MVKNARSVTGKIIDVDNYNPDPEFVKKFAAQKEVLLEYVSKVIATSESTISSRDSYFGSSPFVDMIHSIQLEYYQSRHIFRCSPVI